MTITKITLTLGTTERGALIGRTGCGKTYLAKRLLPADSALLIIDPKRQFNYSKNIRVFNRIRDIERSKPKRAIYRPNEDDFDNIDAYNRAYKYAYNRGEILVYTDDIVGVIDRYNPPRYLRLCYQMGRERKVSCLSCFQRPSGVPLFLTSEADKYYCFKLALKDDIKRVQEYCIGYDPTAFQNTHEFAFYDPRIMEVCERVLIRETVAKKE